jgi:peptide/nickel transport system permease protein
MLFYILRRLLQTIPVVAIVAVIVFSVVRFSGVNPAAIMAGENATTAEIESMSASLGLNDPLPVQFVRWTWRALQGDLGRSFAARSKTVGELIGDSIEPTLSLTLLTMVLSVLLAVPIGVLAARHAGTWKDRTVMGFSVLGFSIPVFVIGYLLTYLLAIRFELFPTQGYRPLKDGVGPWFYHLILPTLTLTIVYVALIARMTRTSVIEVLGEDYVRTARAKGQTERKVLFRHALRNAAVPIVTVIGLGVALLIGGAIVTENVFSLPGLGRLTVNAVLQRDYPVIQGVTLLFSLTYVLVNLIIDIIYTILDPRIRY